MAIQSFGDAATERLFRTGRSRDWAAITKVALRKLDMLDAAEILADLRAPPGNRLEALSGNLVGLHSIRINDQFRICFHWTKEGPEMSSSSITTDRVSTHPGEVLREEFMRPLGLSASALARALNVPPNRVTSIVAETAPRAVTPDTALRLARCFGTSPRFWLNLQIAHDLSFIEHRLGTEIAAEVKPLTAR